MRAMTSFYGINIKLESEQPWPNNVPRFCTTMQELQAILKLNKSTRFKLFYSQTEAEAFSRKQLECRDSSIPTAPEVCSSEKPSPYRGPSRQEFQTLRGLVESGDVARVRATIADNPRYLVNSGDTPTLLREGPRQNALHLAAMKGHAAVCRLLLETVRDRRIFLRIYPDDTEQVAEARSERALDMYLNMPTKGSLETPLHLAAKFGHADTVSVLVQHPVCRRGLRNKYDETPLQLVCRQHCGGDEAGTRLRQRIESLLQDPFYVPVLADDGGCMSPVLASPCSSVFFNGCRDHHDATGPAPGGTPDSPLLPALRPRSWAGPMPLHLAEQLYQRWRSPGDLSPASAASPRLTQNRDARVTDCEKGLERIGRVLAAELKVGWREYWPFLGKHLDMASEEGLNALEHHISQQSVKLLQADVQLDEVSRRLNEHVSQDHTESPESPVGALCLQLNGLHLYSDPPSPPAPPSEPHSARVRQLLHLRRQFEPLSADLDSDTSSSEDESDQRFFTAPNSASPVTPDQAPEAFVCGARLSRADFDVYRALVGVLVDSARFPCVANWLLSVERQSSQGQPTVGKASQYSDSASLRSTPCRIPSVVSMGGSVPATVRYSTPLFHNRPTNPASSITVAGSPQLRRPAVRSILLQ